MKRLICYADIETAHQQGENYLIINEETIVTPLAKDLMEEYQFEIRKESPSSDNKLDEEDLGLSFSKESLIALLRKVLTEGNTSTNYFEADTHKNGLKVVKGDTVKLSKFETANDKDQVFYQELVGKKEMPVNAGMLEITESTFDLDLTENEINYVVSGSLTLIIDGTKYHAKAGDTIYIPNHSKITWCVKDHVKLFYVTGPTK